MRNPELKIMEILDNHPKTIKEIVATIYPDQGYWETVQISDVVRRVLNSLVEDEVVHRAAVTGENHKPVAVFYIGDDPIFEERVSEMDRSILSCVPKTRFVKTTVVRRRFCARSGQDYKLQAIRNHLTKLEKRGFVDVRKDGKLCEWKLKAEALP